MEAVLIVRMGSMNTLLIPGIALSAGPLPMAHVLTVRLEDTCMEATERNAATVVQHQQVPVRIVHMANTKDN